MSTTCAQCQKTVFFAEKQSYDGKDFHGLCLQTYKKNMKSGLSGQKSSPSLPPIGSFSFVISLPNPQIQPSDRIQLISKGRNRNECREQIRYLKQRLGSHFGDGAPSGGFCAQCGTKASGGKFCASCGAAL